MKFTLATILLVFLLTPIAKGNSTLSMSSGVQISEAEILIAKNLSELNSEFLRFGFSYGLPDIDEYPELSKDSTAFFLMTRNLFRYQVLYKTYKSDYCARKPRSGKQLISWLKETKSIVEEEGSILTAKLDLEYEYYDEPDPECVKRVENFIKRNHPKYIKILIFMDAYWLLEESDYSLLEDLELDTP